MDAIEAMKQRVEAACPRTVSCADILALAARDSLVLVGGPTTYPVLTGRRDSAQSFYHDGGGGGIPPPNATYGMTQAAFARRGREFTYGAGDRRAVRSAQQHREGAVRCRFFADRIWNFAGTGAPDDSVDPDITNGVIIL
jgi:peroxidase